ncbi:MAG: PepSY-like domain-containing protein [Bacteroides sp.]|nr:PepSY-like domain-containing protein [Bacteroides sp.]
MKKVLSTLMMAFAAIQMSLAGNVVTMDVKMLPQESQQFIKNYFPNAKVNLITIDKGIFSTEYEVKLTRNVELKFDSQGNWKKVDCGHSAVPEGLVPAFAKQYVKANFPNERITEVKREGTRVKVELSNDVSIKFNKSGRVIAMDD